MGFASVKQFAEAEENGRTFVSHFRKSYNTSPQIGLFFDTSMFGGGPPANYYASTPLTAAVLAGDRGFYIGDNKSPSARFLTHFGLSGTSANNRGQYTLQDYLLYYPFIDCDDVVEQSMTNDVTLPRYTDGEGVMVMAVCVSPSVGNGTFTFNYVNHAGVAQTSPVQTCPTSFSPALLGNTLTGSATSNAGVTPYCRLAAGDRGVRSITSCTFSAPNGGLMCLSLVKPITDLAIREAGTFAEKEFVSRAAGAPRIYDGAYLSMVANPQNSQNSTQLTGYLRFAWDEGV